MFEIQKIANACYDNDARGVGNILTDRQRRLLMLLMTAHGWRTSDQLAEVLGVSSRLVKLEVSAIRRTTGASCAIQSSTRCGYRLAHISDELRSELTREFDVHEWHHSITHRYAQLFLFLLFADAPVSMACLSRRFLCSKTSIAEELEVVRYRVAHLKTLELSVDARYGVMLSGPEVELRYEAAKWLHESFLDGIPFETSARHELAALIDALREPVRRVMRTLLVEGRVSGEDVARVVRYAAVTVWRSRGGHHCGDGISSVLDDSLLEEDSSVTDVVCAGDTSRAEYRAIADAVADAVIQVTGYRLDDFEFAGLEQLMSDTIMPADPSPEDRNAARRLAALTEELLGRRASALVSGHEMPLAQQLAVMRERVHAGHGALNYQASLTMARYPLEGYVALRFLATEYSVCPTVKAEAARLALDLADALAPLHARFSAVLYSDESIPVVRHLADRISLAFGDRISTVRALPVAEGMAVGDSVDAATPAVLGLDISQGSQPVRSVAVALTTDAAFSAAHPDTLLVSVLPTAMELTALRSAVDAAIDARCAAECKVRWHEVPADAATVARVGELLDVLGAANTFVGSVDAGSAVLITIVRCIVVVWWRVIPAFAEALPAVGTVAAWSSQEGLRFRGKRYHRVVELTLPDDGEGAFVLADLLASNVLSP